MLHLSCFQNVHLSGLRCVCSIRYRQTNHSTIMLSTPSLLLIIDQVITACVAPLTDIRCQERERENLERERSWESVSTLMSWSTAGFWIAKPVTYRWQLNVKTFGFQFWSVAESHKSCSKFTCQRSEIVSIGSKLLSTSGLNPHQKEMPFTYLSHAV